MPIRVLGEGEVEAEAARLAMAGLRASADVVKAAMSGDVEAMAAAQVRMEELQEEARVLQVCLSGDGGAGNYDGTGC